MKLTASLWLDRDPEFSLILNLSGKDIIIKNPYIYNKDEWIKNYNLINDDKDIVMNFNNITLRTQNNLFNIIDEDITYELDLNKDMILNCFLIIINSKAIIRYKYWSQTKSLIK